MGVVRSDTLYRTDTGRVMTVSNMEASHLMNAIAHHQKQLGVCEDILSRARSQELVERAQSLRETILTLSNELLHRDPTVDTTLNVEDPEDFFQNSYGYR